MGLFRNIWRRLRHSGTQAATSSAKKEEELMKLIDKTMADLEFWHSTFRKFSVVPCAYCKKQMRVYPYGGAYYTIKDNRKVHVECYDLYLAEDDKLKTQLSQRLKSTVGQDKPSKNAEGL